MITAEHCQLMADYNRWMNRKLYGVCAGMEDAARKQDRGAFFGSIHSTLNHILYGDLAFMCRFTGEPEAVPPLGVDLYDDFDDMRQVREALDHRIVDWAAGLTADWLAGALTYESKVDGITRTVPHGAIVTHMFNHQTHHRGQAITLLNQVGLDVGTTDIPFMPRFNV